MKSTYILFILLVTVCYARQEYDNREDNRNGNRSDNRGNNRGDNRNDDSISTQKPQRTSTTLIPTLPPCIECQNTRIFMSDSFAGQCFPSWEGATCTCLCDDVTCKENEIIDRSTCIPDGNFRYCRCMLLSTTTVPPTVPTTVPPTYPTTVPPTYPTTKPPTVITTTLKTTAAPFKWWW